jgi:competence protein ComGC
MSKVKRSRGFSILSLMLALVIIFILVGSYSYLARDKETQISQYKTNIDRSKRVACMANRTTLETMIQSWQVTHLGEKPTIEKLKAANYSVPTCPSGGTYTIDEHGGVHCSVHPD